MKSGLRLKYFVVKPEGTDPHAKASRAAMRAYAKAIANEDPRMRDDLLNWVTEEESKAKRAQDEG